jgi:O-antigen ligase
MSWTAPEARPSATVVAVVVGGCVAALGAQFVAQRSASLAYAIAAVAALVIVLVATARRPAGQVVIAAVIAVSALIDIPQHIHLGSTSGQGVESFMLTAVIGFLCLNGYVRTGISGLSGLWALPAFLGWCVVSFTWGHLGQQGLQNILVYASFVGMIYIGATLGRTVPERGFRVLDRGFLVAAIVGMSLYALSYAAGGHGSRLVVSPRPFGLFGVLIVAWFMAAHLNGSRLAKYVVAAAVFLTLVSLSRSALAAQLAVIVVAQVGTMRNFNTLLRMVGVTLAVIVIALATVFLYQPLNNRFFKGDKHQFGGISLNVTGRDALWSANWAWFKQRPVIGWGAGSSDQMTSALPGAFSGHPHNDYLRLLVDYGVVGLLLWIIGYALVLRRTWRLWRQSLPRPGPQSQVCAAAFLALTGIAITMMVDNPLIEVGKMAPLGAIAGMAIGMAAASAAADRSAEHRIDAATHTGRLAGVR